MLKFRAWGNATGNEKTSHCCATSALIVWATAPRALPQALNFCACSAPLTTYPANWPSCYFYYFSHHPQNSQCPCRTVQHHPLASRHGGRDTIDDCHTARSHGARAGRQSVKCFVLNVICTPAIPAANTTFAPPTAETYIVIIIKTQKDYSRRGRSDCQKLCNFAQRLE